MNSDKEPIGPVILGSPDEFATIELVDPVNKLISSGFELVHEPLPQDDLWQR